MTLAPRVEVYTQLACYSLHTPSEPTHEPPAPLTLTEWEPSSAISLYSSLDPLGPHLLPISPDPRTLPSHHCLTDPAVQASAARLQTLMTTTMGILSALTTTFWGRFSQSHGRTRVLAISTFGLLFTDLVFILTSTPTLPWPLSAISYNNALWDRHKHYLLLIGPLVEGTLGGWSTLQSATSSYISDCTSVGGRAGVFSRFTGVFYVGFSVGPMIAGWIVRHPEWLTWSSTSRSGSKPLAQSVTGVFWVAIICNFINLLLVLFVFPESLDRDKLRAAADLKGKGRDGEAQGESRPPSVIFRGVEDVEGVGGGDTFVDMEGLQSPISPSSKTKSFRTPSIRIKRGSRSPSPASSSSSVKSFNTSSTSPSARSSSGSLSSFLLSLVRPLSVFLPVFVDKPTRNGLTVKRRRDWSLTFLAAGLALWMLSTGSYQIKYLYAGHTYGWGAKELSSFISWIGAMRAIILLGIIPWAIEKWKPKAGQGSKSLGTKGGDVQEGQEDQQGEDGAAAAKASPTRLELGKFIRFDLRVARLSLFVDLASTLLIAVTPSPSFHAASLKYYLAGRGIPTSPSDGLNQQHPPLISQAQSEAVFVLASSLGACGSGLVPAIHSLALCIVQARGLEPDFGLNEWGLRDVDYPEEERDREEEVGLLRGRGSGFSQGYGHINKLVHAHYMSAAAGYGATGEWDRQSSARASSVSSSVAAGPSLSVRRPSFPATLASQMSAKSHHSAHTFTAVQQTVDSGTLFGAFAVLQSLGQMILGPMLFGFTYSATVSKYPKTVFVLSSGLLLIAMILLLVVKNPVGEVRLERREKRFRKRMMRETARIEYAKAKKAKAAALTAGKLQAKAAQRNPAVAGVQGTTNPTQPVGINVKAPKKERAWEEDIQRRGRSHRSKDLRGGAVSYGSWMPGSEGMVTRSY